MKGANKSRKLSDATKIRTRKILRRVANGETILDAAQKEGYSYETARSGRVTVTRSWNELLEEYLSDDKLIKATTDGLESKQLVKVGKKTEAVPDMSVRHKFLSTALKLRSKFPIEKFEFDHKLSNDDRTDTDVESRIQKLESFFTKKPNKK